ncbi:MAG: protein kinase domain-containing protein [Panacagrimonas sp.]
MAKLRAALGDDDAVVIRTQHGYGYRLAVPVTVETVGAGYVSRLALEAGQPIPRRTNWELVQRLGAGAFGEVWLGTQARTGEKRVFKFCVEAGQLAALKREVTLSRLFAKGLDQHPGLLQVLDWNLEEPPYYLETEWCEHGSIVQWFERQQGGIAAVPLALRIDFIIQTAETLAAAHGLGVLHKDLKPSNLLVVETLPGEPRIKLADWGSGRVLDLERLSAAHITRMGFTENLPDSDSGAGTPMYLAPEVAAGQPSTLQADVYALGVLLFQMVAGDLGRGLAPGWELQIEDELLREDIAAAGHGDPTRRLADAATLATRLRTLAERRTQRAETRERELEAERTRAALSRARARRGPMLALITALVVGLGVSSYLLVRVRAALATSEEQTQIATAVSAFVTRDLLSAANPLVSDDPSITVRELLGSAAAGLEGRFERGTLVRAAVATAIGDSLVGVGDSTRAEPLLQEVLDTRRERLGEAHEQTQEARYALINLYVTRNDAERMTALAQEMLAAEDRSGSPDPVVVVRARHTLVEAKCAIDWLDPACIEGYRRLLDQVRPELGRNHDETLKIQGELAYRLAEARLHDESITLIREAIDLTSARPGVRDWSLRTMRLRLVGSLNAAGQHDEAVHVAREIHDALVKDAAGIEAPDVVRAGEALGVSLFAAKNHEEALPLLQRALEYNRRTRGETFVRTRDAYGNVAQVLDAPGRPAEAVPLIRKAYELDVQVEGPDHSDSLWRATRLAQLLDKAGDVAGAEAVFRDTLARSRNRNTDGDWFLGDVHLLYGQFLARRQRASEALPLLREAVRLLAATLGPEHARTKQAREAVAEVGA